MASLHVKSSSISSPSYFPTQKIFFSPTNFITFPPSLSFNSLSYITPNAPLFKTHKSLFLAQAAVETPVEIEVEKEEEEDEEEDEESRTRVCVQNVPWDCSASDIRPLFEKFGTVVSVEVSS